MKNDQVITLLGRFIFRHQTFRHSDISHQPPATSHQPSSEGNLPPVIHMSVRARIATFFGLLILGALLLVTGVAIMIEKLNIGASGGPVAMGLFVTSMVLVPVSFWILSSGPKRPR